MRIVWNLPAFRQIRTSPETKAEIQRRADKIADACGNGYEAGTVAETGGRGRARSAVYTNTPKARRDNAKNHTLMRNIGAGRGS